MHPRRNHGSKSAATRGDISTRPPPRAFAAANSLVPLHVFQPFHVFRLLVPSEFLRLAEQIVEQVLVAKRYLETVGDPSPVTGVVFMGMGEPFDNYDRCENRRGAAVACVCKSCP